MTEIDSYFEAVRRCSFQFQWIEVSLKFLIATTQSIMKSKLLGTINYRPDRERLDKLTLGKLIDTYERFGGDLELVSQMRGLVKERNALAHEAFVLSPAEHDSPEFLVARAKELDALNVTLSSIVRQLHSELKRLISLGKNTAEPGATDNPDDAQRLREDH